MSYTPHHPYEPPRGTSGLGIASLVLGILGFFTCGLTSLFAAICGHMALKEIKRGQADGRGVAVAGTVLGWIITGGWLLFWGLWLIGLIGSATLSPSTSTSATTPERVTVPLPVQETTPQQDAKVVFEAISEDGATTARNITISIGHKLTQDTGVPLPYVKEAEAAPGDRLYLWAQIAGDNGTVTCRIKVNGKVVREDTSAGSYGVCTVSASVDTP